MASLPWPAVPALILLLGGLLLPESPNSLVDRGYETAGRDVLEKLRGTTAVNAEFEDIKQAVTRGTKDLTNGIFSDTVHQALPAYVLRDHCNCVLSAAQWYQQYHVLCSW